MPRLHFAKAYCSRYKMTDPTLRMVGLAECSTLRCIPVFWFYEIDIWAGNSSLMVLVFEIFASLSF